MIGNDIVDLKQAAIESNWRRKGYLQKVFTTAEQQMIVQADAPDVWVWLFWSMKEAAYKVFSRERMLRSYAPARIACAAEPKWAKVNTSGSGGVAAIYGQAVYDGTAYLTKSVLNLEEGYIHTLSARESAELEKSTIEIGSGNGLPYRQRSPASVSHHGRYLALVFRPSL